MSDQVELIFDISQDELPIFLAEVDEHLQALDEILIQMERLDAESDLVQTAFRAAHTLKGTAGMIGHRRMTNLMHAMETALDGVRKRSLSITTPLIDLCLDAVDGLRKLRDEVINGSQSDVDVDRLVDAFNHLMTGGKAEPASSSASPQPVVDQPAASQPSGDNGSVEIQAKINQKSVASAARAFQLMMALQELGEILSMSPTSEQIETAAPVREFSAKLATQHPVEKIKSALAWIAEVDELTVSGGSNGAAKAVAAAEPAPEKKKSSQTDKAKQEPSADTKNDGNHQRKVEMTVRTSVERLDTLMNLVGELITDRNHLYQIRSRLELQARGDGSVDQLTETVAHLGRITDQLQEEVMRIRMLPIGNIFNKFPRLLRDMAQKTGKLLDLVIEGEDTEMDRSMIEEINDPLIHLVRNAVDHGIEMPEVRRAAGKPERGTIRLTAKHEQGRILLTVEDDGKGVDPNALRRSAVQKGLITKEEADAMTDEQAVDLMFMPGLSTAQKVTDISGRGVGMDIVHNNIQRVNGTIHVETQAGKGTVIQIVLPLTLAIVPTLLVKVERTVFAIPLVMVTETLRLKPDEIQTIRGKPVTRLRESVLSIVSLADIFAMKNQRDPKSNLYTVVVNSGKNRCGLVVDALMGEEEVVVKSLGSFFGDIPGISSAAILGDGRVALIVDVPGLFRLAGVH